MTSTHTPCTLFSSITLFPFPYRCTPCLFVLHSPAYSHTNASSLRTPSTLDRVPWRQTTMATKAPPNVAITQLPQRALQGARRDIR